MLNKIKTTDPNYIYLIQNGYFKKAIEYSTVDAILLFMPAGKCHQNTNEYCKKHKEAKHILGFVYSGNRWLEHSWAWDGKLIETTGVLGNYYFGIEKPDIFKKRGGDIN